MPFSSIHSKRVRGAVGGKTRRRKMRGRRRTKRRGTVGGRVLRNRGGGNDDKKKKYNFIKEMFERYTPESNLLTAQLQSDEIWPETVNLICIKKDIYIYGKIDRYPAFGLCTRDEITPNNKIVQVDFYKKNKNIFNDKYTIISKNVDFSTSNFPPDQDQQNSSNADLHTTKLNEILDKLNTIMQEIQNIPNNTVSLLT